MAISFVAAGTVATGANPTVTLPTGYALDDFLIIVTAGSATTSTPTGWTLISAEGAGQFITTFYKFAAASESSVALTNAGSSTKAVMLAYRGVGLQDVVGTYSTATATTLATNTQTTLLANDYVISIYANASGAARTWTAPGSTTSRVNSATTTTVRGLLIVDEAKATAGATTARTATISASSALAAVAISIRQPQTLYWRGATGTWNTTTKTNWSITSGGTGSVAVPNQLDNVIFDVNSNTGTTAWTVTISNARCNNLNLSTTTPIDAGLTFAGGTSSLFIYGSMDLNDGTGFQTWTGTPTITFGATATGKTIGWGSNAFSGGAIIFDGIGGEWTSNSYCYADPCTLTLTNGSLIIPSSANSLSVETFDSNNSNVRALTFSSSGYIATNPIVSGTPIDFTTITNLTITGTPDFQCYAAASGLTLTIQSNSGFTETTAPNITYYGWAGTATINGNVKDLSIGVNNTGTSTIANTAITIYGSFTQLETTYTTYTAGTNTWTFAATSGTKTITTGGLTLNFPITFNGVGGTWQLQDALTIGSARTLTLTNGTLNLNNNNLTTGLFSSNNSNTRTITSGTGQFYLTGASGTIWGFNTATGLTYTTTPTVNATAATSGATTRSVVNCSTLGDISVHPINLNITAGTDILGASATSMFKNVNFTGYGGASVFTGIVTGNLTLSATMTITSPGTMYLVNPSAVTQTLTSNGVTLDNPLNIGYRTSVVTAASGTGTTATLTYPSTTVIAFPVGSTIQVTGMTPAGYNGTYTVTASTATTVSYASTETGAFVTGGNISIGSQTVSLSGALTLGSTRSTTLASGTLALNTYNHTFNTFASNVDATRSITTSGGQLYTANATGGTVLNINPASNYTGTNNLIVNLTGNATTVNRAVTFASTSGGSESNAISVVVTNGSDAVNISYPSHTTNITLTSGYTGNPLFRCYVYGNLDIQGTLSGWTTDATNPVWFASTSGTTRTINTNGNVINQNIQFIGAGGSWNLLSNLDNSIYYLRFQYGTFNANGYNVSTGSVQSSYTTTRTINMGTGTWTLNGSGTIWSTSTTTGLTLSGASSTLVFQDNSTTARVFSAGSAAVFGNLVFSGSNIVTTSFQNAATWGTWSSTKTSAFTITLPSSLTQTVADWTIQGSAGNLVTLNSSTAGSRATLSKSSGVVNGDYLDITDSNATGGATWNAGANSVDSGNNLGWIFGSGPLTAAIIEAITSGDTYDATVLFYASTVENLASLEAESVQASFNSDRTEDSTLAETEVAQSVFAGTATEASTLADTEAAQLNFNSSATEASTLADSESAQANFNSARTENSTLAETETTQTNFNSDKTENSTLADTESASSVFARSAVEDSVLAETDFAQSVYTGNTTENSTLADSESAQASFNSARTENSGLADTEAAQANFNSDITENSIIADSASAVAVFAVSLAEDTTLADAQLTVNLITTAIIEAFGLADEQLAIAQFSVTSTENSGLGDSSSNTLIMAVARVEDLSSADTASVSASVNSSIIEALSAADIEAAAQTFTVSDTEGFTSGDVVDSVRAVASSIVENSGLADVESALRVLADSLIENSNVAETETTQANFNSSASENSNLADAETTQASFNSTQTENSGLADLTSVIKQLSSAVTEALNSAETSVAVQSYFAVLNENLDAADFSQARADFNSFLVETLGLSESQVGYGWFRVVDSQTVVWNNVNNTQSVTWNNIGNAQSPNWIAVRPGNVRWINAAGEIVLWINDGNIVDWEGANMPAGSWTDVQNPNTPVWTDINNSQGV